LADGVGKEGGAGGDSGLGDSEGGGSGFLAPAGGSSAGADLLWPGVASAEKSDGFGAAGADFSTDSSAPWIPRTIAPHTIPPANRLQKNIDRFMALPPQQRDQEKTCSEPIRA